MFKKISLLLLINILLTGCVDEQPTDDNCVSQGESMADVSKLDFSEHFTICKSLDKNAVINNVFDKIDPSGEPLYTANEFITEAEASINQHSAETVQEAADINFAVVQNLSEFFRSHSKIISLVFVAMLCNFFLLISLKAKQNPNEDLFHPVMKSISIYILVIFFAMFVISSQHFQKSLSRNTLAVGNGFSKNLMADMYDKMTYKERLISYNFNNQAHGTLDSMLRVGICLNNNRKTWIQQIELAGSRSGFDSVDEVVSFYKMKNQSYFMREEERNGQGVRYHYNSNSSYPVLSGIEVIGCGLINFDSNTYSGDMVSILRSVDFSKNVYDAVVANDFKAGWENIEKEFDVLNPTSNDTVVNRKTQLLIAYKKEFTKGLIAGAVLFDEKTGKTIKSDKSNFNKIMSDIDKIYSNINKSVCINKPSLVFESFDEFKFFNQTGQMFFYYCIDLNADEPKMVTTKTYLKNNDEIKRKTEQNQDIEREIIKAQRTFSKARQALADNYKNVHIEFKTIVKRLYNPDEQLTRFYNCGMRCLDEYWKTLKHGNAELEHLYSVNGFYYKFDYSKSLPYYNSMADGDIDSYAKIYDMDFVEQFIDKKGIDFDIIHKLDELNGTIATDMLKTEYQTNVVSVDSEYQGDLEDKTGFMNGFEELLREQNRIWCVENQETDYREKCIEYMINGGGVQSWEHIQTGFTQYGIATGLAGFTVKRASSVVSMMAEKTLDSAMSKDAKEAKKFKSGKKKKSSKATKIATGAATGAMIAADGAAIIGGWMILTGAASFILGLLMEVPDLFISSMLIINGLGTALLLRLIPLLILSSSVMFVIFGLNHQSMYKYALYIFRLTITPICLVVMSFIVVSLSLLINDLVKNYAATVIDVDLFTGMFVIDSGWSMGIGIILMALNAIMLIVPFIVLLYFLIKVPGWIAKAADRLDPITLMKTRADDADSQNQMVKNSIAIAGMKYGKQLSGLDGLKQDRQQKKIKNAMNNQIKEVASKK